MQISEAVDALTRPWQDAVMFEVADGKKIALIWQPALLDMLRVAIHSDIGGTTRGGAAAAERNVIDPKAFSLYEHIDGAARSWWKDLSKRAPSKDLKDLVRELAGLAKAMHASRQIDPLTAARLEEQFEGWRTQIWQIFDPPVVKEILGTCPKCDARWVFAEDGGKSSAIILYYVKSEDPEAKCQRCNAVWVGVKELRELGFHIGATSNEDALREMGHSDAA
jgi:hypothetical protein